MNVTRLNQMHRYLWLAGRPTSARALHKQRLIERQIVITEQADLHLVWLESRLFVKPLPDYLLNHQTWTQIICEDRELHASCCGFLLSYIWLLCYPSDLRIAIEHGLVTPELTWNDWTTFVEAFLNNVDCETLDAVNKRYQYGELRLQRLNIVYRFTNFYRSGHLMKGYMYGYNRYTVFFERNLGWVVLVFLYLTIILTAMQVGLATTTLQQNGSFRQASSGFAIFSMVLTVVIVGTALFLAIILFILNLLATRKFLRRQAVRRRGQSQAKARGVA
jgi:succinate dehydrogenase/fumarate reductase cytochrome b subunit